MPFYEGDATKLKAANVAYDKRHPKSDKPNKSSGSVRPLYDTSGGKTATGKQLKGFDSKAAEKARAERASKARAADLARASRGISAYGPGGNVVQSKPASSSSSSSTPSAGTEALRRAAVARTNATGNAQKAAQAKDKASKATALSKYQARSALKSVQTERQRRSGMHQFKGDYWGPDAFKGDQKKIDAWKAAGKPKDKSKFA